MPEYLLRIDIDQTMGATLDCPGISGEQLMEASAAAIAAAIKAVEMTWETAHGKSSGQRAGQRVIDMAGQILKNGMRPTSGSLKAETEGT